MEFRRVKRQSKLEISLDQGEQTRSLQASQVFVG